MIMHVRPFLRAGDGSCRPRWMGWSRRTIRSGLWRHTLIA
jgi:hypothetical protein